MFSVTIWGDRGSMPTPGPDTAVFGGNTACIEVRCGERLIIIDAGSGIRPLGERLLREDLKKGPISADLFITHTHWDHIMGFPMFNPIYVPGTKLRIRGPISYEDDSLEKVIGSQLSYRYWPVRQDELAAEIEYEQIKETTIDLGDGILVSTKYLNHPILCLGYRIEYEGKSFVTVYDNEPFRNVFPTDPADPNYDEEAAREGEAAVLEREEREGPPLLPRGRSPGPRHPIQREGIPEGQDGLRPLFLRARDQRLPPGAGEAPRDVPPRSQQDGRGAAGARAFLSGQGEGKDLARAGDGPRGPQIPAVVYRLTADRRREDT